MQLRAIASCRAKLQAPNMKLARVAIWRDCWSSKTSKTAAWKRPISTVCPNLEHTSDSRTSKVSEIRRDGNVASTDTTPSPARGTARDNVHSQGHQTRGDYRPWTAEESGILMKGSDVGLSSRAIAKLLPGRVLGVIQTRLQSYRKHGASVFSKSPQQWWTPDERARFLELRLMGLTNAEMKLHFPHRSFMSIQYACQRLAPEALVQPRRSKRPYTAAENELCLGLAARRIKDHVIAKLLDRTVSGVSCQMSRLGVNELRRKWTRKQDERMLQLRKAGLSAREVANLLGATVDSAESRWCVIRPTESIAISPKRIKSSLALTSDQIKEIKDLRRHGCSWHAIQKLRFPDITHARLHSMYRRQGGHLHCTNRKDVLSFSSADIELIQRLRLEGKTWQVITDLLSSNKSPKHVAGVFRRHVAMRNLEESKEASRSGSQDVS